jgi:integrase
LTRQEAALVTSQYAGHRFGLPAMVMMWAGLRTQECFALRWEDIDLKENIIHVRRALDIRERSEKATKTENSVRDVPIFAPLQLPLQRAYKGREGHLVFTQEDGGVCSKSSIKRGLESFLLKLSKASGDAVKFSCHDLRDTFATMCYDAGVDAKTTQKWMGHSDITTTMKIYTKLSEERQKDSTDLMDGFVASVLQNNG